MNQTIFFPKGPYNSLSSKAVCNNVTLSFPACSEILPLQDTALKCMLPKKCILQKVTQHKSNAYINTSWYFCRLRTYVDTHTCQIQYKYRCDTPSASKLFQSPIQRYPHTYFRVEPTKAKLYVIILWLLVVCYLITSNYCMATSVVDLRRLSSYFSVNRHC